MQSHAGKATRAEPGKCAWHRASPRLRGSPQRESREQGTVPASGNDSLRSAGREDGAGTGGTAGSGCEQRAKRGQSSGARASGITGVERGLVLELPGRRESLQMLPPRTSAGSPALHPLPDMAPESPGPATDPRPGPVPLCPRLGQQPPARGIQGAEAPPDTIRPRSHRGRAPYPEPRSSRETHQLPQRSLVHPEQALLGHPVCRARAAAARARWRPTQQRAADRKSVV